jgi:hypothetical protein
MKIGFRVPSLKKRIAARTSVNRYVRHNLGLKAPRGWGWLTNPRKAAYNRIYRRTTFGLEDLFKASGNRSGTGCLVIIIAGFVFLGFILIAIFIELPNTISNKQLIAYVDTTNLKR